MGLKQMFFFNYNFIVANKHFKIETVTLFFKVFPKTENVNSFFWNE